MRHQINKIEHLVSTNENLQGFFNECTQKVSQGVAPTTASFFGSFKKELDKLSFFKLQKKVTGLFPAGQFYSDFSTTAASSSFPEMSSGAASMFCLAESVENLLLKVYNLKNAPNALSFHQKVGDLIKEALLLTGTAKELQTGVLWELAHRNLRAFSPFNEAERGFICQALQDCNSIENILSCVVDLLRLLHYTNYTLLKTNGSTVAPQAIWANSVLPLNTPSRLLIVRDFDGVEREFNQFLLNDQELLDQYFKASSNPG